jgi:hypothetical protein
MLCRMSNPTLDDDQARLERARQRRETWRVEPLSDDPPPAPESMVERFRELERLRRIGFALAGIAYPEGPTPKHERRLWPVERIR